MKIENLTPFRLEQLDPTHDARNKVQALKSAGDFFEKPADYIRQTPDEMLHRWTVLREKFSTPRHAPLIEYDKEHDSKYGAQGGRFPWSVLTADISEYFTRAERNPVITQYHVAGRDYLMSIIQDTIDKVGYPQYVPGCGAKGTYSGIPVCAEKGSYLAETVGMKPYRHMLPAIPGQRRMRNKDRVIFMDANPNVRALESFLTGVRTWLATNIPSLFGAWRNPRDVINPWLTAAVNRNSTFVESDYKAMDKNFSWPIVQELILPILELFGATPLILANIEELFNVPLFMGHQLWTGKHNLLSGQPITNDFETLYSIILGLGISLFYDCIESSSMLALGDDVIVELRKSTPRFANYWFEAFKDASSQALMEVHSIGKSRIARGEARFLRKVYYPAMKRDINGVGIGAYPPVLVLNNIVQPEKPSHDLATASAATLQRLDNAQGTHVFHPLVDMVVRFSTLDFKHPATELPRDWWERLYGEKWDPESSPSYRYINRLD